MHPLRSTYRPREAKYQCITQHLDSVHLTQGHHLSGNFFSEYIKKMKNAVSVTTKVCVNSKNVLVHGRFVVLLAKYHRNGFGTNMISYTA